MNTVFCEKCAYIDSSGMADHVLGLRHSPVCLLQACARFTCAELCRQAESGV